jgi:hypothetical protein
MTKKRRISLTSDTNSSGMFPMKVIIFCTAWALCPCHDSSAQQAEQTIDYQARQQSVATLKKHIAAREERFEMLKKDVLAKDARLETQIDSLIKQLVELRDSKDSRTKVANMKDHAIEGLVRSIWIYRQKRVTVFERMRRENIVPKEELEKTLKAFDERINKRVSQVMELAKSYPGHEDLNKYETYDTSYYNGYYEEDVRISEDWKQNRRDEISGRQAHKQVLEGLDKAIETNQTRRVLILNNLASKKIAEKEKTLQQEELGRIDAAIDNLRNQRRELLVPEGGAGKEIGADDAHDVEQMLDDARTDLSRDFSDIMRLYSDLEAERTRLYGLKNNLKAREEWLKNNPPPAP